MTRMMDRSWIGKPVRNEISRRILCAATKAPWPPRDGGRLLLLETLKALAAVDQRVDLVAPVDPGVDDPAAMERELRHAFVDRTPRQGPVRERVGRLLEEQPDRVGIRVEGLYPDARFLKLRH